MKRFLFWFLAAGAAFYVLRSSHDHHRRVERPAIHTLVIHRGSDDHRQSPARQVVRIERNGQVIQIRDTAGDENDDAPRGLVEVDGIPVPIEPGTRVTEARPEPPRPPAPPKPPAPGVRRVRVARPPAPPRPPAAPAAAQPKTPPVEVAGRLSATEERARNDARSALVKRVAEWVSPEVPAGWHVPDHLIDGLVREVRVAPHEKGGLVGTVYDATLMVDLNPDGRDRIVRAYRHEQTVTKLGLGAGVLALVLALLATVSGYIRADEATKGYYTNRLRVAAGAALGAAGVAAYRWLT